MLLRTSFAPDHVVDGKAIVTAVAGQDLESSERGFSVDREELSNPTTIINRALTLMSRDPLKRNAAWISRFNCGALRSAYLVEDKMPAVIVQNDPIMEEPEPNPAHSIIYSASKRSRSGIKALKSVLVDYINEDIRPIEDFYPPADQT